MSAPNGQMARVHASVLGHRLRVAYTLDVPCIRCGAVPGVWCRTTGGNRSQDLHRVRCDLAGRLTSPQALARYVVGHGWHVCDHGGAS